MSKAFWNDYRSLVAKLMPPLGPDDGVPEAKITAAEVRLGLKLPVLLRDFYLVAGRREDINAVHNRLLSPESLEVDQQGLVFYEENQSVVLWGIKVDDLSQADPQVFIAENATVLEWEPEHDHLSEFLTSMLFWQAVNGGMAYHGIGAASSQAVTEADSGWEKLILAAIPLGGVSGYECGTVRCCSSSAMIQVQKFTAAGGPRKTSWPSRKPSA